jgi:hypothetical protein
MEQERLLVPEKLYKIQRLVCQSQSMDDSDVDGAG